MGLEASTEQKRIQHEKYEHTLGLANGTWGTLMVISAGS
jgi:hypothetical protein